MKIVQTVPHIDEEAAGPSYTITRLCERLSAFGHEVVIRCLAAGDRIPGVEVRLHEEWPVLRRLAIAPGYLRGAAEDAGRADIVHNNSLWSMVNMASGWVVPGKRAKLVTSPHGTLSEWALRRHANLKKALWGLQRPALTRASLLHATSDMELGEIRALGLEAPVAVVPNGIDIPAPAARRIDPAGTRTLLFLSRIHPKKGIENLLAAWGELEPAHRDWRMRIVGVGDADYTRELQKLALERKLSRVEFPGPLYGADKAACYRNADLFVLPTFSENFGMVVAEALAHGCPVVVSHGAPWREVTDKGCGWWVGNDPAILAETLDAAMRLPLGELARMGNRGREWMVEDFGWDMVARKMEASYRWLLDGGERPAWVFA